MSKKLFYFVQDPRYGGGLKSMGVFTEQYLVKRGVQFSQVFLSAEKALSLDRIRQLDLTLNHEVRQVSNNFRKVLVSSFPYIEPFGYLLPWRFLKRELQKHDVAFGIVGYATHLYFMKLAGVRYYAWLATTLDSEKKGQPQSSNVRQRVFDWLNRLVMPISRYQEKRALLGATRLYTISAASRREMIEIGVPEERIELIYPPVDTDVFTPPESEEREPYILCVCRLEDPRKNIPLLLDAFSRLIEKNTEYKLALVGPYDQSVIDEISKRNLTDRVTLPGKTEFKELVRWYQRATMFVLSSRQEGFGIVLSEAMASGLPVISTKSGGPEDVVVDGKTGYLVDHTAEALSEKMMRLVENQSLCQEMGRNGRERIVSTFSYKAVEKKLDGVFAEVLSNAT